MWHKEKNAVLYFIFFRPFRLSLAPIICPWVSEDDIGVNSTIKAAIKLILEQKINARFKEKTCFNINNLLFSICN